MAFFMYKIIFRINYQTIIFKKKKKSKKWWWEFKRKEQQYVIKSSDTNESRWERVPNFQSKHYDKGTGKVMLFIYPYIPTQLRLRLVWQKGSENYFEKKP